MIIRDGQGNGYEAAVDNANRLQTKGIARTEFSSRAEDLGLAFQVYTPMLTVTTTNGLMWWFRNDSTTRDFHIEDFYITWNGGSTNFDRGVYMSFYAGTAEPSANNTAGYIANTNFTSASVSDSTQYHWDEVGTGMTTASAGGFAGTAIVRGFFDYKAGGSFILGANNSVALYAQAEEIGELSIIVNGWYSGE